MWSTADSLGQLWHTFRLSDTLCHIQWIYQGKCLMELLCQLQAPRFPAFSQSPSGDQAAQMSCVLSFCFHALNVTTPLLLRQQCGNIYGPKQWNVIKSKFKCYFIHSQASCQADRKLSGFCQQAFLWPVQHYWYQKISPGFAGFGEHHHRGGNEYGSSPTAVAATQNYWLARWLDSSHFVWLCPIMLCEVNALWRVKRLSERNTGASVSPPKGTDRLEEATGSTPPVTWKTDQHVYFPKWTTQRNQAIHSSK